MGILETRHGIITESVHLIFVTFLTESSKESERRFFYSRSFLFILCHGLCRMSVSCQLPSVLSIIRDNFLYIIITNIINQQ